jgi:hypothetical protein
MDKKNLRPAQAAKGLVSIKKGQDVLNKTGQRHGNRREGTAANKPSRDFANRPTPPRLKTTPKTRGGNGYQRHNVNSDQPDHEAAHFDDEEAELYSVFAPGSKKQNLNHLLNFHYAPRERYGPPENFGKSSRMPTNRARYDKRQFLQANCQFLVQIPGNLKKSGYSANIAFADTLVDWEPIEQIYLTTYEDLQCPICLFPPVACKITKCGHIYCYPCILHYLALSDKTWRRCPICHEAVTVNDLKSAIAKPVTFVKPGDFVTLQLMKRDKDSLLVVKAEHSAENEVPMADAVGNIHSKIFMAEVETILEIVEREKHELLIEMKSQGSDCPESVFVEQALTLLDERRAKLIANTPLPQEFIEEKGAVAENCVYFYQASDGQHMYLHPINCKMLETMYGHVKNAPHIINGKILQKESRSMNDAFRKRYKHLAHLPLTCEVDLVEIEFTEPEIPKEIIQIFQSNLKQRESKRMHKENVENKRSKQIEQLNNKQLGFRYECDTVALNIDSVEQFPICVEVETSQKKEKDIPSFAKVMQSPKQSLWPTLPSSGGLMEFVSTLPKNKKVVPVASSPSDISDDFLEEFDRMKIQDSISIGGAIAEAIEKAGGTTQQSIAKSKKKGKKGVTLFATGIAFSGSK